MTAWPLLGFLAWRDGGLDFSSPLFLLATLFVSVSGPLQTLAAWRLSAPELKAHPRWFVYAAVANLLAYTEFKNLISRVAHLKQLRGEHKWVVTPRTAQSTASSDDTTTSRRRSRRLPHDLTARRPDSVQATPGTRTTYPLGWLRGLAALAVVFFHAYQHNRTGADGLAVVGRRAPGDARHRAVRRDVLRAVGLRPLAARRPGGARQRTGRPGWVLLFRRMARLLPLYYVVVLVVWTTTNPSLPGHWQDLLMHLTFTHVYSDDYIFWTVGPAWSLGVEFHFYVLMALSVPLVAAGVRRADSRRGRLAVASVLPVALTLAGLGYLAWTILVSQPPIEDWSTWFSPSPGPRLRTRHRAWRSPWQRVSGSAPAPAASRRRRPGHARPPGGPAASATASGGTRRTRWRSPSRWPRSCCTTARGRARSSGGRWPGSAARLRRLPGPRAGDAVPRQHRRAARGAARGFFVLTAVLVAIPSIALAWVSSRTVEVGGLKLLSLIHRDGRRATTTTT